MIDDVCNLCKIAVSGTYDAVATAITLLPSDPNLGRLGTPPFDLLWWNEGHYPDPADDPKAEFVRVTAIPTSNTLTVTRGQQGIAASTKNTAGGSYKMLRSLTALDVDAAAASRTQVDGWYQDNVAASQSGVALSRLASPAAAPTAFIPMRAGSITGIAVYSNDARTAGTLTVEVNTNGAGTGLTAVLDDVNTTFKATTQDPDTDTFVAGDRLTVEITTDGSWAPTTADIQVTIEIED